MRGKPLKVVKEESDICVTINSALKHPKHCKKSYYEAQTMLGFIVRIFECKMRGVMLSLYNSVIRPHLECAAQFWSPNYRIDIRILENI